MKWAKGDLVVTANYKSTFPLMSLLLHWFKCSWLGINTLTFALPQCLYITTAHFATFTAPVHSRLLLRNHDFRFLVSEFKLPSLDCFMVFQIAGTTQVVYFLS